MNSAEVEAIRERLRKVGMHWRTEGEIRATDDATALLADRDRIAAVVTRLRGIAWHYDRYDETPYCCVCGQSKYEGHTPDCEWRAVLYLLTGAG